MDWRIGWTQVATYAGVLLGVPTVGLALLSLTAREPTDLGVHDGKLAPLPTSPNAVSSQAEREAQRVEPLRFQGDPATAMAKLRAALAASPRVTFRKEDGGYVWAEARTLVFRFVDDLEFLLDADAGVIHCRAAARSGYGDGGANRRRVERLRAALDRVADQSDGAASAR